LEGLLLTDRGGFFREAQVFEGVPFEEAGVPRPFTLSVSVMDGGVNFGPAKLNKLALGLTVIVRDSVDLLTSRFGVSFPIFIYKSVRTFHTRTETHVGSESALALASLHKCRIVGRV
jgi:hypothetical protein